MQLNLCGMLRCHGRCHGNILIWYSTNVCGNQYYELNYTIFFHSTKLFTYILALYIFIGMTRATARVNGLVTIETHTHK